MNQTVKRIVDLLFEDTVENEETRALHEELIYQQGGAGGPGGAGPSEDADSEEPEDTGL